MATKAHAIAPLPAMQRYFEVSLYLLVCTGVVAAISTGRLDVISTFVPAAALAYKGVRLLGGRPPEISSRLATALVLGYFLFFPFDLWLISRNLAAGSGNPALYGGVLASIHLLLFATVVRLFSARTRRDYIFLAMLAFAAMLASAILTVDTTFLATLAVFVMLAVSTFAGLEIWRSSEGAVTAPMEANSAAARRLHSSLWITSVCVAAGTLILGAAIFFLIPRFTAGYLSALNLQPTLLTGFTENVRLGQIGEIKKSTSVVMRIRIEGDPLRAADTYWRGVALLRFDGRRWSTPPQESTVVESDSSEVYRFPPPALPPEEVRPLRYSVLMEPLATNALFLAAWPIEVRGRFGDANDQPLLVAHHGYLVMDGTGSVFAPAQNSLRMQYSALSETVRIPPARLRLAGTDYPEAIRDAYLQLPALDPRIPQLALQAVEKEKNPYDKAAAIEQYLRKNYGYTLDLTGPEPASPLPYFLFERRAGHCEYFASAMVIMLRTLGIPARYITGFLPGQYNDVGGDYIVRASDAHSWVEAYFPKYGWVAFDPTPAGAPPSHGFLERISFYVDWLQYAWSEWVINYDVGHQITLARNLQQSTRDWTAQARSIYSLYRMRLAQRMNRWERRLEDSRHALPLLLIALVLILMALRGPAMVRWWMAARRLHALRQGKAIPSVVAGEYREMLEMLERRGWIKPPGKTAREFATSIGAPELALPVARLTEMYEVARFGNRVPDTGALLEQRDRIRAFLLKAERRKAEPA